MVERDDDPRCRVDEEAADAVPPEPHRELQFGRRELELGADA